jgi:hypothetical protein
METCPQWLQDKLFSEPLFALYTAKDPSTPTFILEALANNTKLLPKTREALLKNPNLSAKALLFLCPHSPREVLQNPAWPLLLLEDPNIFEKMNPWALCSLLQDQAFPASLLPALSNHKDQYVRQTVASNPRASEELLRHLAHDRNAEVRRAVVSHHASSQDTLQQLIRDKDKYIAATAIVRYAKTSEEDLCRIAENVDPNIRTLVLSCSRYPKSHYELLLRAGATKDLNLHETHRRSFGYLTADEIERLSYGGLFVKKLLAQHPQTPEDVLFSFAQHRELTEILMQRNDLTEPVFRRLLQFSYAHQVAHSKNFSKVAVDIFAESTDFNHREAVAARLDLSLEQLIKLLEDKELRVQKMALCNLKTPATYLASFAVHADKYIRIAVAKHPNTPTKILLSLLGDPECRVRRVAADNPKTPKEAIHTYLRAGSTQDFEGINFGLCKKPRLKQRERELLAKTPFGRSLLSASFSYEKKVEMRRALIQRNYRSTIKKTEKKDRR